MTDDDFKRMGEWVGDELCRLMGLPRERLRAVALTPADPALKGTAMDDKMGLEFDFEPKLSSYENKRFVEAIGRFSKKIGSRAPVFPGSA